MTSAPTRFLNPCPVCGLLALISTDGLEATCQACNHECTTDGLTINRAWTQQFVQQPPTAVVYYLRFGDRVKIGTTTNLKTRMQSIPYDELLGTEPGSYDIERERHQQFRAARIYANREWFNLTEELHQHIAGLPSA